MALIGDGLLAIWHDIQPDMQDEYMEWHTREHMPERVGIAGFRSGKRLINRAVPRYRYGTLYCGDDVEVFRSEPYLDRLNAPTPWTLTVQPAFRNFLRVACRRLVTRGAGDGGAITTIRLDFADGAGPGDVEAGAASLAEAVLQVRGVCCAHVALAQADIASVRTRETELRPAMAERGFDVLVLAEGSGRPELEAVSGEIERILTAPGTGLTAPATIAYELAYHLADDQLA